MPLKRRHKKTRHGATHLRKQLERSSRLESLEQRLLLTASPWQNPSQPTDVNNDGVETAIDALMVVNHLSRTEQPILGLRSNRLAPYYDVNGDGLTTAGDAIRIINNLSRSTHPLSRSLQRLEGESEPAPAGFISMMFGALPGNGNEKVELTTSMSIGGEEFNELGFFVVDSIEGDVGGLYPNHPDYPDAVFGSAKRQVAYSRRDVFQTEKNLTFDAGQMLGVYILQRPTSIGDSAAHLRVTENGGSSMMIGWEEHASPSWIYSVGDRGYDDVRVEVQIGEPFAGNSPPNISAIANRTINEQTELTINVPATDADLVDGDRMTFSLDEAPSGMAVNSDGVLRWTPTEQDGPGTYNVTVRATDLAGLFDTQSFMVTVNEVNLPPILAPIDDKSTNVGVEIITNASATDPDVPANKLTYSISKGPAGANINPTTGEFRWTPAVGNQGSFEVELRVEDGQGGSDLQSFNITVGNRPPEFPIILDPNIDELTLFEFLPSATDPDGDSNALQYTWELFPSGAIPLTDGRITWTPTEAQGPGTHRFTVRATDPQGAFATASFNVLVNEVNLAPILATIPTQRVDELALLSVELTAADADLPANTLVYSIVSGPDGASIDSGSGQFTWTPTEHQGPGTYNVTVQVNDQAGGTDQESFVVEVREVNVAPNLQAISDQIIDELTEFTITAVATDEDRPANSLMFSLTSSPTGATIHSTSGLIRWTPTETDGPGSAVFEVRVSDSADGFDTESFTVTVNEVNIDPVLEAITTQTVDELSRLEVQLRATDADLPANTLTYTITSGPDGATINSSTGLLSWTPTEEQGPGAYNVTVRVSDNVGGTDETSFGIEVREVNVAPVLAPINDQIVDELVEITIVAVATDADVPANTLVYSLDAAPTGATIDSSSGQFRWTPTEADGPGTATVIVRVSDGNSGFDTETFVINVLEVNRPPVLESIPSVQRDIGTSYTFTASATDPDLPANTLSFSLDAGAPTGATIDPDSGEFTWTVPTGTAGGDYPITVRVTDNGSPALFDTKSFTVTVTGCAFDDALTGWTAFESGGSASGKGSGVGQNCAAVIREGDSFVVGLERSYVIPGTPTAIQFTYEGLAFDTADAKFINDAFEVALVDVDGNSLVQNYASGRDAFLNITEGLAAQSRNGILVEGNKVTVGLGGIPSGTNAKLVFRLVNNDSDTNSEVRVTDVRFISSDLQAATPEGLVDLATTVRAFAEINIASNQQALEEGPISVSSGEIFVRPNLSEPKALTPKLEWKLDQFSVRPESKNVIMTPAVADLNHDGIPDIVFSTYEVSIAIDGVLRAASGDGSGILWSIDNPDYAVMAQAGVAVGDIDGDGRVEVIATRETGHLIAFEDDGTFKWQSEESTLFQFRGGFGSASIADLDQDGTPEIVLGGVVYNADGTIRSDNWGVGADGNNGAGPLSIVADVDLDGKPNIVTGATIYEADGSRIWGTNVDGFPALGNFDSDRFPEIVVVANGTVRLLNHDLSLVWGPITLPGGGLGGAPTIADLDGDGQPEIGVAGAGSYTVFETDGSIKWSIGTQLISSGLTSSSVFDFDGDGRGEIVYGDRSYLNVYSGMDGTLFYRFPFGSGAVYNLPLVVDVDGDGKAEIVGVASSGGQNGIYVWGDDENWSATRPIWNQHSYHITNINDDGSIPRVELNSWEIYNNYRSNQQPTATQIGPPLISVTAPNSQFAAGRKVLVSGLATGQGERGDGSSNAIAFVTVNGQVVDEFDGAGNFFELVTIASGDNRFEFTATDSVGQTTSATINLIGFDETFDPINFSKFTDTSGSFSSLYFRTSFDDRNDLLFADLATKNDGTFASDVPLLVGVKNISDPTVSVVGIDGVTPDGVPYFDYSPQVADGVLSPGETSASPSITFHNPNRIQFDYELVFYGKLNAPPEITSIPDREALTEKQYVYSVTAIDEDNDTLSYRLSEAPAGMSIVESTGQITWTPTTQQIGNHPVVVQVDDGRGGQAEQRFTLSLVAPPPNRPPVIVSKPITNADALQGTAAGLVRVNFDELEGIFYGPGTQVEPRSKLSDQYLNSKGVVFTTVNGPDYVAVVDLDTAAAGHAPSARNGIGGVTSSNSLDYGSPIRARFFLPNTRNTPGVTNYVSIRPDTIGDFQTLTMIAFDVNGNQIGISTVVDTGSPLLSVSTPNIHTVEIRGSGTAGFDDFYFNAVHRIGGSYEYQAVSVDLDNDILKYSLPIAPSGLQISEATGLVFWAPAADQVGNHQVKIQVSDGRGGIAEQEFVICVHPDLTNHDPIIISSPVESAPSGPYRYAVEALDADDDTLMFSLVESPSGMTISATTGQIEWQSAIGVHRVPVRVRVTDGRGGIDEQFFEISLRAVTGEIRGTKTNDANGDGVLDTDEVGMAAWTIYLDQNQNGLRDDGEISTLTDGYGDYAFTGLPVGTYYVREESQTGWTQTFPSATTGYQGDGYADVIVDSFDNMKGPYPWPYGQPLGSIGYNLPVSLDELLGPPSPGIQIGGAPGVRFVSIPQGSHVTFGFEDEYIVDGPGNDVFVQSLDDAAGEFANVYVGSSLDDLVFAARIGEGGSANIDLASINYQGPVSVVRVEGLDNNGGAPGFDLVAVHAINRAPISDGFYTVHLRAGEVVQEVDFGNVLVSDSSNTDPEFDSTPVSTAIFGNLYRYEARAKDGNFDTIAYSMISGPDGMTIHPTLGTVVWQPRGEQLGSHLIALSASDGRGGVALQSFEVEVLNPNTAPVFVSAFPDQAVQDALFSIDIDIQDADGDLVTLALDSASVGSLVESANSSPTGEVLQSRYRFEWMPTDEDVTAGSRRIAITANDGRGGIVTQSLDVTVVATATNRAPEILSPARTVAYAGLDYVYAVSAVDPDGNRLNYSLETHPEGMTISNDGVITWTPPTLSADPQSIKVVVSDGRGGEDSQSFDLRIATQSENTRPRIVSNPKLTARDAKEYVYDAKAIDDQGDPILWSLDDAPLGMSINAQSGAIRWTPRDDQGGVHQVSVRATDFLGASTVQSYSIDVSCVNTPPLILSIPITTAFTGESYYYGVRAIDPDGDQLTYSLDASPTGMSVSANGLIRWTPNAADAGESRTVVVRAQDEDGAFIVQDYTIVVGDATNANRAPVITSIPVFNVTLGDPYRYAVLANDPDGETLTYSLIIKPDRSDMAIDSDGLVTWTPTAAGVESVVVEVKDPNGAIATQGFVISARANQPPMINSAAGTEATAGATYRYSLQATDPDNDPLSYTLVTGPTGMTLDAFGRLLWNVPADTAATATANIPVTVRVNDPRGAFDEESFTLVVSPDTLAPKVELEVQSGSIFYRSGARVDLGASATIRVVATDNVAVTELMLEIDGKAVTLDAFGRATITGTALGTMSLRGIAKDSAGNLGEAVDSLIVIRPGSTNVPVPTDPTLPPHPGFKPEDTGRPNVEITSPVIGASVTNLTSIIGTINDPENNLWYWRAYYARLDLIDTANLDVNDPDVVIIAEGTNEITDAEIAKFDPTKLDNDAYVIMVAAYDVNGLGEIAATIVTVEGSVKLGHFNLDFTDLTIPLAGIPIQVTRVYDTRQANREGDFGYGWMLGVQDARILEVAALGTGGAFSGGNDKLIPDKSKVYLTNPSGQRVGFTYTETYAGGCSPFIGCPFGAVFTPSFVADPGVYDTLTIDETQVGRGGIADALGGGINPDVYTLTTKEGTKYRYNQFTGLEKITDRNGQTVSFTETGIEHSSGTEIQFVRDHRGRIKEVIDPDGQKILYEYDAAGDLRKVTLQTGLESTYNYLSNPAHYLDEGFDDLGNRDFKVTYDDQNRFKAIIDGVGNVVGQQNYDELANNRGTVLDANGNATELLYDARGNVLEETDAVGNVTIREYSDPRNPDLETKIIDRRGMVSEREYDGSGNVTKIIERGHKDTPLATPSVTEFVYNGQNEITSIKNASGATTIFDYDSQGNVIKIVNALGDSSAFTYDEQGRRTSFTDFNGNTTTFDYTAACPCGSPSKSTNADGTYQTFQYNQFGQVTQQQTFEADGTLVERMQTFYDSTGRVTREVIGGGNDPKHPLTDVRKFYDGHLLEWEIIVSPESLAADGTLLESPATPIAQRKSRITEYKYDARDNLITQIDAMGGIVQFRYDAQGNRVLLQDPVGNITTWTYDTLNRVAEERDPFYWVDFVAANSTLDIDALLAAVVEENEQPSTASLATNQGAAHVRSFAYDAEGNQSKMIDRNNRRREFSYDHAGRLLEERWYNAVDHATAPAALVETVSFTYDSLGNMLTAVDSNSRYLHTYDALNRLTRVDNNPLDDRNVPRVILTYAYDAQGNVISTSDDAGVTVASEYDSRNRLAVRRWFDADVPVGQTRDVDNARVDFFYTAAGREKEVHRYSDLDATALVGRTLRNYDLAGRSDILNHVNAIDNVIAGYDYDYDFSGLLVTEERSHQDEQYAQSIQYKYDLTGQLVEALFEKQDDELYEYDLNGNRKSARIGDQSSIYAAPGPANQLTSDGRYNYEYNGEGNMVKRIHPTTGETRTFQYDHRSRLTQVDDWSRDPGDPQNPTSGTILAQSVEYTYDALGRRIARGMDPDGTAPLGSEKVSYIYNGDNVWADLNEAEIAVARYLLGDLIDHMLGLYNGALVWLLADGQMTVRNTTNETGAVLAIEYAAFGAPLEDVALRYTFAGREFDVDNQLYYFRHRYYLPHTAKFLGMDLLGLSGDATLAMQELLRRTPHSLTLMTMFFDIIDLDSVNGTAYSLEGIAGNLYRFLGNSPLQALDPTGLAPMIEYNIKAQEFIGKYCVGKILREFPAELLLYTVEEIMKGIDGVDVNKIRKARKLLKDNRFRKC